MKNITFVKKTFFLLFSLVVLISCDDKMEEHYEVPDWLKGSAWDVLESADENYSIFLEGVELAGFKPIVQGKNIMTVMAPDDEAFTSYLTAKGYSSIKDMDKKELQKLIGFHLLYYSYNKEALENFRPLNSGIDPEENKEVDAGLYYKFRSRSNDGLSFVTDPGDERKKALYHLDRFVPVFSHRFFKTKQIDAKSNYEYFYPESTWSGDNGFNVSNATVTQYQVLADNGYIYKVDRVLEPLETLYTELNEKSEYSIFNRLYDKYSFYEYDPILTVDYGDALGVDSIYMHNSQLAPIALEWPISSSTAISTLSRSAYTLIAPTNNAMNSFFNKFWKVGGYESIDDVETLALLYFLYGFYTVDSPIFPEQIEKKLMPDDSWLVDFNFSDVKDRAMCVNGTFYGLNAFSTPGRMASVVGPVFQYKDFTSYLYILSGSGMLTPMMSQESNFITLIPSNEQLETEEIFLNEYTDGKVLEKKGDDGEFVPMGNGEKTDIFNMHVLNEKGELKKTGTQVHPTQVAFNYWYVKDGKITSSAMFNNYVNPDYTGDPFTAFEEIVNEDGTPWSNGKAYSYKYDGIFRKEASDGFTSGLNHDIAVCNDARYPYYMFSQLLKQAGLVVDDRITGLLGSRFVAFIPTNDVLKAAINADLVPGIIGCTVAANGSLQGGTFDLAVLSSYLRSYFITNDINTITTYPYPGSELKNGEYVTTSYVNNLIYTDNGTSLSVQIKGRANIGRVVPQYNYFPFAYEDGGFHLIDSIL